ncbi:MAG: ATP phosphoribosyltransferase [Ruminococcaceae bacterium]|nr:ATP phosphoribosyltransferase [Oscillospiraceae bacterium]
MSIDLSILSNSEKIIFQLRSLYAKYGYKPFKMSKFEEYDLYGSNKDFLVSGNCITFTDSDGRLLALKPDVTFSIIKNLDDTAKGVQKVYYNENVYRVTKKAGGFSEIMQTGIECMGDIGTVDVCEVITLAARSLYAISENYVLDISHMGILSGLFTAMDLSESNKTELLSAVAEKNIGVILALCEQYGVGQALSNKLIDLLNAYGKPETALKKIGDAVVNAEMQNAYNELCEVCNKLTDKGYQDNINIDCSVVNDMSYYNGIVFKGFIHGVPTGVLSGGRYDRLMERVNKKAGAIGFAVYLDEVDRILQSPEEAENSDDDQYLNIALPKGRLGEKVYAMFEQAGFECPQIHEKNRRLIFENTEKKIRYFWVKPSDVAIYVERGAADIGVAGKDILLEYSPDVYELLDMNMGKCRMCVAGKKEFTDNGTNTLRVATKFENIAKNYYADKCRDIDIIKLNGSIEIAPILGLSDVIVDIVETGATLLENGLEPKETIVNISARLISNKASYKFKSDKIDVLKEALSTIVREKQ